MTDKETIMALNEIIAIRTLENKSPKVETRLLIAILDLITIQGAEIEKLKAESKKWKNAFMGECTLTSCKLKSELQVEAIKEFAKKLKSRYFWKVCLGDNSAIITNTDFENFVENVVKKMTESEDKING